eukprot:1077854_1
MTKHEAFMKQMIDTCKPKDGKKCLSLQRYQGKTNHITKGNLNNDSDDTEFEFYKDIMDSIHCSFYHPHHIEPTNADKYTLPKLDIDDSGALLPLLVRLNCPVGIKLPGVDELRLGISVEK